MLGGSFQFYSIVHRIFCKQTVEILIRRRALRCLIWVYAVCQDVGLEWVKEMEWALNMMVLFDLIFYVPSTIFQLCRDGSSSVEPVLS